MKPLLAHIYEPHRVSYPCYVQPKLNGIRALYQNGCFQSRDQLPFPTGLLEHLAKPLRETFDPSTILDGELYVHGWPLQRINAAVTPVRQTPTEDTIQVQYHVFDVVDFTQSFGIRHQFRLKLLHPDCNLVETHYVESEIQADIHYADFVSRGYEGMMYRLGDCPYTTPKQLKAGLHFDGNRAGNTSGSSSKFLSDKSNRCWHLLKRKDWQDDEFVCVGVQEGEGKYQGALGALICRLKHPEFPCVIFPKPKPVLFHVGSGLTDAERDHYWANPPIGKLIKVKYLVLSNAGIPLNPTILCIL